MAKLMVTFGQGHRHVVNGKVFDKDCVAVIEADTVEEADAIAFKIWDGKFHQHTGEDHWDESNMHYFPRGYLTLTREDRVAKFGVTV